MGQRSNSHRKGKQPEPLVRKARWERKIPAPVSSREAQGDVEGEGWQAAQ